MERIPSIGLLERRYKSLLALNAIIDAASVQQEVPLPQKTTGALIAEASVCAHNAAENAKHFAELQTHIRERYRKVKSTATSLNAMGNAARRASAYVRGVSGNAPNGLPTSVSASVEYLRDTYPDMSEAERIEVGQAMKALASVGEDAMAKATEIALHAKKNRSSLAIARYKAMAKHFATQADRAKAFKDTPSIERDYNLKHLKNKRRAQLLTKSYRDTHYG